MQRVGAALLMAAILAGCEPRPPARWAEGGTRLEIPRARWTRAGHLFDIMPDGRVLADGRYVFSVDAAGRAFDPDGDPIGVLQDDGRLLGKGDQLLGRIGVRNAALPGNEYAWLALSEQGEVLRFGADGEAQSDGTWQGCGAAVRACTLVTHLIGLAEHEHVAHEGMYGPTVTFGIGFGFGMAP